MEDSSRALALRVLAQLNERDLLPIVRDVCRAHGVTLDELCGTLSSRSIHRARQEAWWRVHNHPGRHYTFSDIGRIFARPPDTIASGVRRHAARRRAMPSRPQLASADDREPDAIVRERRAEAMLPALGPHDEGAQNAIVQPHVDHRTAARGVLAGNSALVLAPHLCLASRRAVDRPVATLAERILSLVRTGSYMSVNGIVHALAASGHGARRQDVFAAVTAMLADGRLSKVNELFRAADP
jgi:hypothetical protein